MDMEAARSVVEAEERLQFWFDACPRAAIALSGGVDSSLVAFLARTFLGPEHVCAYIADSPSLKRKDLNEAKQFCQSYDITLEILHTQELENANYASNPNNRCYFCKSTLYDDLVSIITASAVNTWICSGANLDDQGDYRPGMQAAAEHAIKHPLLMCGINKALIRELAAKYSLPCHDKPASPCLSSRIPYGQAVTKEKLQQIEAAETWLQEHGFDIARVRHDQDIARLEVPADKIQQLMQLQDSAQQFMRSIGFNGIDIDQEGFVSGKLNRSIST